MSDEKKEKSLMRVENEVKMLNALYLSNDMIFNHERYRVQLTLFMQLTDITNNRSEAVLKIRYRNIKIILLRDSNEDK